MCCMYTVYSGMQEWVLIQISSIPILVSVLFPSLHLKYFRIKFLLLVDISNITRLGRLPSTGEIIVKRGQVPYENGVPWKLPKSATALDSQF